MRWEGEIWLNVTCSGDGVINEAVITDSKTTPKPLKYIREPGDEGEDEEEFTYCFLLAKVEKVGDPLVADGNFPYLVAVKQYALGAVYCDVAPDELELKAGKGIEIKKDDTAENKKEIAALIEDAAEPSSNDYSLIYDDEGEGAEEGVNKGIPYKIKLLCTSDDTVSIKDAGGRIYLSAEGKLPGAGDGLEYKMATNAAGIEEATDTLKIKIDSTVDSEKGEGKWPVNLSVSPAGLKGELDLTVDTEQHDVGGGRKVGLSTSTKGALALEVTSGKEEEPLSFRQPLRKNGIYVVLDYDKTWSSAVKGVKARLVEAQGALGVGAVVPWGGASMSMVRSRLKE